MTHSERYTVVCMLRHDGKGVALNPRCVGGREVDTWTGDETCPVCGVKLRLVDKYKVFPLTKPTEEVVENAVPQDSN